MTKLSIREAMAQRARRRRRVLRVFMAAAARDAAQHAHAIVAEDDRGLVGVALWMPPGTFPLSAWRKARMTPALLRVALVARGARPLEGEGMASGDVVNTAARLQTAAPVDGILVGEATHAVTHHAVSYEEATPVVAKGKEEPIAVWEALEARSRLGVDLGGAGRAELVGRGAELDLLVDALARTRRERVTQLVTLVGVPGIGKSRLVYELGRVVDEDPELITWRQGRSLPYGEGVSFWALGEIVKAQAGILESDPAEVAGTKGAREVIHRDQLVVL